jgi:tripartite-type tricarboxylate transporter receptor subunit TctC
MKPTRRLILQLNGALSVASRTATAQSYPTRPVRIIVSLAAGGTPDIICRIVVERFSEAIGQPVIIESHPGASNVIGAQLAAKAAPDGYTSCSRPPPRS